jgi:hypothetical protein
MKKLLSLFILMLLPMLASAQTAPERRMLEQGKVWAYTYHHFEARETPTADSSYYDHSTWLSYYQLEGDTVIDGRTYMKLYRWDDHDRKHKYFGAFREDDEGKVFMYNLEDKKQDDLVLDFSLHYNRGYFPDVVRTAETIKVGDQLFRRYRYQDVSPDGRQYMLPYIAIEGIGFIERGLIFDPYAPEPDCICDYESLTYVYDDHFRFSASDFHAPKEIERSDYLPFVEIGKQWHVVSNPTNPYVPCSYERYEMYGEEILNGKTYVRTGLFYDESVVEGFHEIGLFREENRRVYKYEAGRDVMMYDFSLKEGDTFTYEVGFDQPVNCKVLKQGWLEDGPQIQMLDSLTADGAWTFKYRKLRTWTIGIDNGSGDYYEFITWIEYIGALRNMFSLPETVGRMSCLAYIERSDEYDYFYLPFSLYNMYGPIYGCNIPKMAADRSEKWDSQYTYELEGDRLHVFGKDVLNCVGDYYAYFTEKPTDDPLVHKLHFSIKEVGPQTTCSSLFTTDFSISGFNPNINYIIVDNYGEEHPVINKTPQMDYRPFVEEGKVWKVGTIPTALDSPVQVVDYYYFDGDTIIGEKTCKQMMCQRYVSPNYSNEYWTPRPSLTKVGAWYEEDKKVYSFDERQQTMTLKYDFSLEANDTLHFLNVDDYPPFIIGPKQTGGIEGFKGVYREIMIGQDMHNTIWLEGVGVRDAPFRNAYDPRADLVPEFLISCTVGDEIIYLNDRYEDEATPESMGARKNRFDFTHTIKTKPKARKRSEEEPLLYGEYNDLKLGINLNPLDDAYQVRITDDSGKVVYEKAINAGNIVGLNIDISAYAKGHYTITVENSDETFTGAFEAQTTGIEAISYQPSAVRHHIYNLQGQRLSTLQKGLNIVNGQKIYVK